MRELVEQRRKHDACTAGLPNPVIESHDGGASSFGRVRVRRVADQFQRRPISEEGSLCGVEALLDAAKDVSRGLL